jgi:thiol-disulfide isomerase/thioredoxin
VVFFATWCSYCDAELRALRQALRQVGHLRVIPIAADGASTWNLVDEYLASFDLRAPVVRGHDYPRMATAYDPFDIVPALVIVGRDGTLVDYHVGYDPARADQLVRSLRVAVSAEPNVKSELAR